MLKKPKECCALESCEHQVPMPIKNSRRNIDLCIADIVAALNAAHIKTDASCCGHGILPPTIILEDDRWIVIMDRKEAVEYCKKVRGK